MHLVEDIVRVVLGLDGLKTSQVLTVDIIDDGVARWYKSILAAIRPLSSKTEELTFGVVDILRHIVSTLQVFLPRL